MYSKTIKKISLFLIIVFSLMAGNLYGAPPSSKEIFKSAQEAYKSDKNKKALRLFLEFKNALALNKDEKRERYLKEQLRKINTKKKTSLIKESLQKIRLELLGKTNSKVGGMGSDIFLTGSYKSTVTDGQQYRLSGSFRHDDFTFKTSNFMDIEIDEKTRLIQKTDRFSAKIEKLKGLESSLNSRLTLKAIYLLAEDDGESYKSISLSEKMRYKFNNNWELGFLGSISWKDYYITDRERDYLTLELSPDIIRYINKSFNLNLGYSFYLKQYLNSKYDRELLDEKGKYIYMDSNEDKRYLTHSIAVLLEGSKKKHFYPSLEYIFCINETLHYDNMIKDDDEDRFVKDYGDFLKHTIIAGIAFTGFRDFELDTEASASIKNFSHYPARDSENQFIDGMRKDKSFQFDTSIKYLISSHKENCLGNIFLKIQLFYEYQSSNMEYEKSSETNYEFFTFSAGLKVDLP